MVEIGTNFKIRFTRQIHMFNMDNIVTEFHHISNQMNETKIYFILNSFSKETNKNKQFNCNIKNIIGQYFKTDVYPPDKTVLNLKSRTVNQLATKRYNEIKLLIQEILANKKVEIRIDTKINTDVKIFNNKLDISMLGKEKTKINLIENNYDLLANAIGLINKIVSLNYLRGLKEGGIKIEKSDDKSN
ncbi:hypothetical protein NAPIS_ORF00158 [Vairimorpha apis BRL 01]|uniref:Uncharacterized protein n=1 Tax=Vairimorpha apis BRL 01 TaxID=1037528 RepID=T0MMM0_9MICR|nr:hypothetical protein NAPIS_ORF00158 [Vairimorpha apis BRL 01]